MNFNVRLHALLPTIHIVQNSEQGSMYSPPRAFLRRLITYVFPLDLARRNQCLDTSRRGRPARADPIRRETGTQTELRLFQSGSGRALLDFLFPGGGYISSHQGPALRQSLLKRQGCRRLRSVLGPIRSPFSILHRDPSRPGGTTCTP